MKRLHRSKKDRIIAGVCGGIAEYFNVDPVLIRLLWIVVTLMGIFPGVITYIIAWVIIPEAEEENTTKTGQLDVHPSME